MKNTPKTICYFSMYSTQFPRDRVLLRGFKDLGWNVIECVDSTYSAKKYWNIFLKHIPLRKNYDVAIVAYTGQVLVPLVKLMTRKKIIFNASNSIFEAVILDRQKKKIFSLLSFKLWVLDFIAFLISDIILVETDAQARFIADIFFVNKKKMIRVWTSADELDFYPDISATKSDIFTVLFRGAFLPFVGVEYVVEVARILEKENIKFLILGNGLLEESIKYKLKEYSLLNVELVTDYLEMKELKRRMLSCHIAIGQISCHSRIERTITNKTFEYLALGIPFITADSLSNRELLNDTVNCVFVKCGDVNDLAQKIMYLKNNPIIQKKIGLNGRTLFENALRAKDIARCVSDHLLVVDGEVIIKE